MKPWRKGDFRLRRLRKNLISWPNKGKDRVEGMKKAYALTRGAPEQKGGKGTFSTRIESSRGEKAKKIISTCLFLEKGVEATHL